MTILDKPIAAQPRPIRNYVLVEPNDNGKSAGGLHLPQQHTPEFPQGKVIGLGSGRRDNEEVHDFEVKIGDQILFKMGAPTIRLNGENYVLIKEEDIMAVL